ncbi:amidohydrolase family protein [Verrucomicrobiaceae bacterium N1E253]|uniref:Amidohydrolase family protein n=1 Tax=Oceaniferula marina TaxID=2748318 RepID=A0A851G931_9BACT|nr:amidohydrolase family protein [Oceaniferula marina]NWK54113.1 amidohydrolase family protein [Oceaniferula marina]
MNTSDHHFYQKLTSSGKAVRWIRVGHLLTGHAPQAITMGHVVYNAESILYAGKEAPPAAIVQEKHRPDLTMPDHTLLPGLIEAHAHLFLQGAELDAEKRKQHLIQSPEALLSQATPRLAMLPRFGVIAVRDAGDKDGVGLALSKSYRSHHKAARASAYIDSPGAAIHHQGRYGSFMGSPLEQHADAADCVAARVAEGADRIKLIPTSIINFKKGMVTAKPQMDTEELSAFTKAAREHGKQSFAHASGDVGIDHVIAAGVDTVEHGFFIRFDQLDRMLEKNIAWVPTFAPVQKQIDHAEIMAWDEDCLANLKKIIENHKDSLRYAHQIGVTIIAGSDAGSYGVPHGEGLLYELELMQEAGLPPINVINTATGNSSKRLDFHEKFGLIQEGYQSRMILSAHHPEENVTNLRKNHLCLFDGTVIESDNDISFM